jgi:hypothetical protein
VPATHRTIRSDPRPPPETLATGPSLGATRRASRCSWLAAGRLRPPTPTRARACRPSGERGEGCRAAGKALRGEYPSPDPPVTRVWPSPADLPLSPPDRWGWSRPPVSRPSQNRPPGWARRTSSSPRLRRNSNSPALTLGCFAIGAGGGLHACGDARLAHWRRARYTPPRSIAAPTSLSIPKPSPKSTTPETTPTRVTRYW